MATIDIYSTAKTGLLSNLTTTEQGTLVGAINENTAEISEAQTDLDAIGHEVPTGINIFDGNFDESGYFVNGVDTASTSYVRTSKYYEIGNSSATSLFGYLSQQVVFGIAFYDDDHTWIANKNMHNVNTKEVTIPTGATCFRCYTSTSWSGNVTLALSYVNSYTAYTSKFELKSRIVKSSNLASSVVTDIASGATASTTLAKVITDTMSLEYKNIFDGTFPNSGYFDASGADASSTGYVRTDYLEVDNTHSLLYFLRTATGYIVRLCFYDSTKTVIGSRTSLFLVGSTETTTVKEIPTGATYYRMYTSASDYTGNFMVSYKEYDNYIAHQQYYMLQDDAVTADSLDDDVKSKLCSFYGKTIAFLGDSIVGNFNDNTGICSIIAEKTGAKVINCGFGGTRMGFRYGSNIQYTYWNTLSGKSLSDAITTGTWTDQDTAIANLDQALDYFSDRLATMKAIDWTTVDYILWEYGTNDFSTEVKLSDTGDTTNYYAFDNAYRYAIETILTAYPNIQIIPITPTWRWWGDENDDFLYDSNTHTTDDYEGTARLLTAFVTKVQDIAKEYQLPCIDDYYTLGANKFTRLGFYDSSDGVHPNEEGRSRIAEHIASQLDSVV